ncbi:MAG: M23 family metallopeptidase [Clostridia bacterium]|nr:M23 family metallopeptidase [Clostridia bacterium]
MKNKLIAAIVAAACLIPSGVAYASYHRTQNAPVDVNNAVSISIDDINGKNFTLVKEREGDTADRLIEYFLTVKNRAQPLTALPDSLTGEQFFKVRIAAAIKDVTYQYYLSADPTTCYFVAPDGTPYKMSEEDAEAFITTEYAESLYHEAAMPTLTLSRTVDVTPDKAIWRYKNYTGDYVDSDVTDMVYQNIETYDIDGGLDLTFDLNPDFCSVKISDTSGNVLYDGLLENLSEFTLTSTRTVYIEVLAKWYEDAVRSFQGELTYDFSSTVTAPAEFYLGMSEVQAGRFTAITALNVPKAENITFTSNLPDSSAPIFYQENENTAVALLAIGMDTPDGVYDLTLEYGATTRHVPLTVINYGFAPVSYNVYDSVVQATRNSATLTEFEAASAEIMSKGSATRYFSGYFLEGAEGTLKMGFGREVYLNNSAEPVYRNNGVDYATDADSPIAACNRGQVVYVGALGYTGNIIVIEHGYGLKTWYYNLGTMAVSVGDMVERGQYLGTAGMSGFIGFNGVHIAMSVGDRFVCPYDTWADSEIAGKVILAKIDE